MIKKIINIVLLLIIFILLYFSINYYFSEKNIKKVQKNRSLNDEIVNYDLEKIPLLKNDTDNIIVYKDDVKNYKKEKKIYKFWDLIKKRNNE